MKEDEAAMEEGRKLVERMAEVEDQIAAISDYRNAYRKRFCDLSRRMKLLAPMFEELRESDDPVPDRAAPSLALLQRAVHSAKELLRLGNEGSKIFLVLESDKITNRFQEVTIQLEKALGEIPFDVLNLSDEVREQVELFAHIILSSELYANFTLDFTIENLMDNSIECKVDLVHSQLKRAKERVDMADVDLHRDLLTAYNSSTNSSIDPAILQRLAEKLQLTTVSDLKQESLALHEMVVASDGDPGEIIEKMSLLLKKIKDFMLTQHLEMGRPTKKTPQPSNESSKPPILPDDFKCPVSLELMKDPVIVSTGQTYDRESIEQWLEAGHDTCPKTQQKLSNKSLTPNYVLRSLIAQWCEANGIDPPRCPAQPNRTKPTCSSPQHAKVIDLIRKLSSWSIEDKRSAAAELRLLARLSAENRCCIAEAGAIPLLVNLFSTLDVHTQENAVTAVLNLSILEENKEKIVAAAAVPAILNVLRRGSMEARENAAATLFSLSVVDDFKVRIGNSGAIPPLVSLLRDGSPQGKKDAVLALFNLCIYQGNKGKAVRAGLVPILVGLLMDPTSTMLDETLAILSVLSGHPVGKEAIKATEALPVLIDAIGSGSPRTKENAAATLVHLFSGDQRHQDLAKAQEKGLVSLLQAMTENGTNRGRRKAEQLLQRLNWLLRQKKEAQAQAEEPTLLEQSIPTSYPND